jgi:hypothetical protein
VAYICNPSYLGGWGQEDLDSRAANSPRDPHLQNNQRCGSSGRPPAFASVKPWIQTLVTSKKLLDNVSVCMLQILNSMWMQKKGRWNFGRKADKITVCVCMFMHVYVYMYTIFLPLDSVIKLIYKIS